MGFFQTCLTCNQNRAHCFLCPVPAAGWGEDMRLWSLWGAPVVGSGVALDRGSAGYGETFPALSLFNLSLPGLSLPSLSLPSLEPFQSEPSQP